MIKQWFKDINIDRKKTTALGKAVTEAINTTTDMAPAAIIDNFSTGISSSDSTKIDMSSESDFTTIPKFDPVKHLAFQPPTGIVKMTDIGLAADTGVSPVAASEPFQLFSKEAIEIMRAEIFNPEVHEKCKFSSNIAKAQLRGYVPKYAPFAHEAWNHPATLEIISKIAGVDLVPVFDYEIGHINLSVKSKEQVKEEQKVVDAVNEGRTSLDDDDKPIVGWHKDSYPFVCVLMLSDCTNMVGGETALLSADGSKVMRVRGPQMVSALSWPAK